MKDKLKITKINTTPIVGNSTGNTTLINDFPNEDWNKLLKNYQITFPDSNNIWYPQPADQTWKIDYFGGNVRARCYNRNCNNETEVVTEMKLGTYLELKTYICETCVSDLAEKIRDELGLDNEEEK